MYHETTSPVRTKYYVPIEQFEKQIKMFNEMGVKSWDIDYPPSEKGPFVLFTFDDGHGSNLRAAEILSEYGYKGYFYVVKKFSLYKNGYLTEHEIKQISDMGHAIGVHGYDHKHWTKKEDNQLVSEIYDTKMWIESITGVEVTSCAAPGGVLNNQVVKLIKKYFPEFKILRTVVVGKNSFDNYLVKIVPIHNNTTDRNLTKLCSNDSFAWFKLKTVYYVKLVLKSLFHIFIK